MSTSDPPRDAPDDARRPLLYSDYINVPTIIAAMAPPAATPRGVSDARWPWGGYASSPSGDRPTLPTDHPAWAHDEVLFITVHQVFEVWFRHVLFELDDLADRATRALRETAADAEIPHATLALRDPDRAPRLGARGVLDRYPELEGLVAQINADAVVDPTLAVYADWIRELPEPGVFPASGASVSAPHGGGPSERATLVELLPMCSDRLLRVAHIIDTATSAYDVLRRMTPTSFLEFRTRLDPASGFGSSQFREIEIFSGQRERHFSSFETVSSSGEVVDGELFALIAAHVGSDDRASATATKASSVLRRALPDAEFERVRRRMLAPTLRDLLYATLVAASGSDADRRGLADRVAARNLADLYATARRRRAHGFDHSSHEHAVWRRVGAQLTDVESVVATAVLADDPLVGGELLDAAARRELKRVLEACLELDRALMAWRVSHLSFVECMIGARPGTGGGGLVYLQQTMRASSPDYVLRSFPAVWAARSLLAPPA